MDLDNQGDQMRKTMNRPTTIGDFAAISSVAISASQEERPARMVLPDWALSTAEPKERSNAVALSDWPIILNEDEAGETHLTEALIHRRYYRHNPKDVRKKRSEPNAQRYHPERPFLVLVIHADALPNEWYVLMLKDFYQCIKPAAESVPGYDWRDVIQMFIDRPVKNEAFAAVLFNHPAERLTPRQIRTLLNDAVSQDSVDRTYKDLEASARTVAPDPSPAFAEPASDHTDPTDHPHDDRNDPLAKPAEGSDEASTHQRIGSGDNLDLWEQDDEW